MKKLVKSFGSNLTFSINLNLLAKSYSLRVYLVKTTNSQLRYQINGPHKVKLSLNRPALGIDPIQTVSYKK